MNRDGVLDLAVAGGKKNGFVAILLGDGRGGFQPTSGEAVGQTPRSIAVADLNGDGLADVVVADEGDSSVSVLLGDGQGGFLEVRTFSAGRHPIWVAAGDLDRDRIPDLAVVNRVTDKASVLRGLGRGNFSAPVEYDLGRSPIAGAVADFNLDGNLDVAVASKNDDAITILLGDGKLGFAPSSAATGDEPVALLAVDANADGNPDLVTADSRAGTLSVLLGVGDGSFHPAVPYPAGSRPAALAWGDFDGDCRGDLAAVSGEAGTGALLPGDGNGGFGAPLPFDTGEPSDALAAADSDGDLRPDLAAAQAAPDRLVLLRASGPPPCALFEVRRSSDAASLLGSPPVVSVPEAPFDEPPGTLEEGSILYYDVEHGGGADLRLSVHADRVASRLRLGFNDGNPASAPVDPALSTLTAGPARLSAPAEVLLVPRDSDGVVLGAGLSIVVDENALFPATLLGPIGDRGDGSYRLLVACPVPAIVSVAIAVEGVALTEVPLLVFE